MLIESKFFVPPLRGDHVARPVLVRRLREGLDRRLSSIVAPAGYGKSSCLAELLNGLEEPRCWIALDATDDEPIRFWAHVGHALGKIFDGLGESATAALGSPQPPPILGVLSAWLNDLAGSERRDPAESRGVLALDDVHLLQDPELLRTLTFFIDHLPPSLHLVLAGRRPPDLPFQRWRGRGELSEVGIEDLRFDREETRLFLARSDRQPSPELVATLHRKTEGWGAALQLALASGAGASGAGASGVGASGHSGPQTPSLDGSVRHIADYFAEEVLGGFDAELREFLLRISVLDAFEPSLAEAVTGRTDAARLFENLERLHLPIVRVDRDGRWWRFHWLFNDFLRRRLEIERPEEAIRGRRRASEWMERSGYIESAFRLALAAGDGERARDLLTAQAGRLMARGEALVLIRAVRDLGTDWQDLPPELLLQLAWAFFITHHKGECHRAIRIAEIHRDKGLLDRRQLAQLESIHGALARGNGRLRASKEHFRSALDNARGQDPVLLANIALQLGLSHTFAYENAEAREALLLCLESLGPTHTHSLTRIGAISTLAQIQAEEGSLDLAEATCLGAFEQTPAHSPPASLVHRTLGRIHLARGHWTEARPSLETAVELARKVGYAELVALAELWRAGLERILGRTEALDETLRRLEALGTQEEFPPLQRNWLRALRVHQALDEGNLEVADRLAKSGPRFGKDPHMAGFEWTLASIHLATIRERFELADGLAENLLDAARRQGRQESEIRSLAWRSWSHFRARSVTDALVGLEQAVHLARGAHFVGPFADLPRADALALLERLMARRNLPEATVHHGNAVLEALREASAEEPSAFVPVELTDREMEALKLLAQGFDNRRIGEEMGVAPTTVKTHLRNLFTKLDVRRRTEAVARAREWALL